MKGYSAPPESWSAPVRLSSLKAGEPPAREAFELELDAPIEHWGQSYEPRGPVRALVEAGLAGARVLACVTVQADFTLPCSRCLKETGVEISADLRYLFTLEDEAPEEGEPPDDDGEIDVIKVDTFKSELDFAPYIWETLLLELPERAICRPGCRGLCPICGADLNETECGCGAENYDPRFDLLRDLIE